MFNLTDLKDPSKFKLTDKGLEIIGFAEGVKENIKNYPTYDDLKERHTKHFKVDEKIRQLCL